MSEEDRSLNAAIAAHASWANTSNRTARHIASAEIPPASRVTRRAQPDALGSDLAWTWRKVISEVVWPRITPPASPQIRGPRCAREDGLLSKSHLPTLIEVWDP